MTRSPNPDLDLTISRVIKAPRSVVWSAWTDPASFEQWWVPAPAVCKVLEMDLRPGGAFETGISESGGSEFISHSSACFLTVEHGERLVFTNALVAGFRPAPQVGQVRANQPPFMTAVITFNDRPEGTDYFAHVLHASPADRKTHADMGFHDGWGTVIEQLARLAEQRA